MPSHKQLDGTKGENIAVQYLKESGFTIIETNWHSRYGELDIVARRGDEWVFVEVKARRSRQAEDTLASITDKKREKIIQTIHLYLSEHDLDDVNWRVDAIAIGIPRSGKPHVEHVEDAFDW